jgi:hypothetical protein
MSILLKLQALKAKKLDSEVLEGVVKFGSLMETMSGMYKTIATAVQVTGKALQTPESAQEIFDSVQDIRDRMIDTAINLVQRHQSDFDGVVKDFQDIDKKMSPQPEETEEE